MKRIKTAFALLLSCGMSAMATEEFHIDYNVDAKVMSQTSASERLYNQMVETTSVKPVDGEASASSNVSGTSAIKSMDAMPSYNDMRNLESLKQSARRTAAEQKYGVYTPLKELEWTTVPLVAFGFIAKGNKDNFRAARNNFIPSYKNRFDDNLQLAPVVVSTVLNLAGYQGRSKTGRYLANTALSYAWCALFVNSIKYTAKEMRPDGSTANSFPSGHTATAFTAATILHKEYGLTRSPWWSILGYGCATTTGIMRTLNNRHWISDVLVGAGIGVISTDLGYMIGDMIFKKKGINREPRQNVTDLLENPSFFRLELGMQFNNNLKIPNYNTFLTFDQLYDKPGASSMDDDFYTIQRKGNPFRIPDSYDDDAGSRTYDNYSTGAPAYGETVTPVIKVATGTTVGAEAAYFLNKYVGVGARARITTAPVTAEGLYCYKDNKRVENSASASDVWSMVDLGLGAYLSWPLSKQHNVGMKVLYGRRFFGKLDFNAAYDEEWKNKETGETQNITMFGDNLTIDKTNSDNLTLGVHYTYAMNSGVALSAFLDYDYSKPEFEVKYNPYNSDMTKMMQTMSEFSFTHKINSFTLGASMTVLF